MYFPYFAAYMSVGFVLGGVVFFWALGNGQFRDQQRARFLALDSDDGPTAASTSKIRKVELFALAVLACGGLAASAAVLIFSIVNSGGI